MNLISRTALSVGTLVALAAPATPALADERHSTSLRGPYALLTARSCVDDEWGRDICTNYTVSLERDTRERATGKEPVLKRDQLCVNASWSEQTDDGNRLDTKESGCTEDYEAWIGEGLSAATLSGRVQMTGEACIYETGACAPSTPRWMEVSAAVEGVGEVRERREKGHTDLEGCRRSWSVVNAARSVEGTVILNGRKHMTHQPSQIGDGRITLRTRCRT